MIADLALGIKSIFELQKNQKKRFKMSSPKQDSPPAKKFKKQENDSDSEKPKDTERHIELLSEAQKEAIQEEDRSLSKLPFDEIIFDYFMG